MPGRIHLGPFAAAGLAASSSARRPRRREEDHHGSIGTSLGAGEDYVGACMRVCMVREAARRGSLQPQQLNLFFQTATPGLADHLCSAGADCAEHGGAVPRAGRGEGGRRAGVEVSLSGGVTTRRYLATCVPLEVHASSDSFRARPRPHRELREVSGPLSTSQDARDDAMFQAAVAANPTLADRVASAPDPAAEMAKVVAEMRRVRELVRGQARPPEAGPGAGGPGAG